MTTHKEAVDNTASDYWSDYFGDYGELWVRDIPRRIKAKLEQGHRSAAKAGTPPPTLGDASISPLGYEITADRVILEGVYNGQIKAGRRTANTTQLFRAEFNHQGELTSFEALDAPAA